MWFYFESPHVFVGIISLLICLDIVAVFTRVYARKLKRQKLETDDWLIIPALILNIGMAVSVFIGIGIYASPHRDKKLSDGMKGVMMINFVVLHIFAASLTLIKLSFLFFYKRVFVYDKTNWKDMRNVIIHALIALIVLWGLGFSIIMLNGCRFYEHYSALEETLGKCINTFKRQYAFAVSDFITDVVIILTPIPFIWKLSLSFKRKLGILLVFLLGAFAAIVSMVRMIWMKYVVDMVGRDLSLEFLDPVDLPFIAISTELFCFLLEATVALIAVCLPTISNIFRTGPARTFLQGFLSKLSIRSWSKSSAWSKLNIWEKNGQQATHTVVDV